MEAFQMSNPPLYVRITPDMRERILAVKINQKRETISASVRYLLEIALEAVESKNR